VNKNDLIAAVAASASLSKVDATQAVEGVFNTISTALKDGGEVRLVGFGTFSVSTRKASTGRNPRTGESIQIPETRQPKFNEIGRKLTSLTLMTIMLAGGMVIAAPSMVPTAASAGALYVSAQEQ
jgi:DNA-binding protein HU-beta